MRDAWNRVQRLNLRFWWGPIIAYAVLVGAAYLAIWQVIEPVGFPDSLANLPPPMNRRIFYHVTASLVVASHVLLVAWLLSRWRSKSESQGVIPTGSAVTADSPNAHAAILERLGRAEQEREECRRRLAAYESLEQEIFGLLAPGGDVALHDIARHLGIQDEPDAQNRVRRAVAKLTEQERIEGTGGNVPTLRRSVRF